MQLTDLQGRVAVVIDVLRASTTIVHALAAGAKCVLPCASVEQAWAYAEKIPVGERLLGGERHCQTIEGFDLDNSPLKYTPAAVAGRNVIFTTTNGTYVLERCRSAARVFVGAFVNLGAVERQLLRLKLPVHLVCAGTNRQLTAEDILFAGGVIDRLLAAVSEEFEPQGVEALLALDFYRARGTAAASLRQTMFGSLGAENLVKLGLQADIERALEIDRFQLLPEWDRANNQITPCQS